MNNKKLGTKFEKAVCQQLAEEGYWVHFITPDRRGAQPFDIIAVKNDRAFAIECKTLTASERYFRISRLEDNQILAFNYWLRCGNTEPKIIVLHGDRIVAINFSELLEVGKVDVRSKECISKLEQILR